MAVVRAGPNEFLLVGRHGTLENRGSAVQAFLWPGTVYVLVPSTKQEAVFEFTQETKDGIPLRFKSVVIYRITDPTATARLFDFGAGGVHEISTLLTHICLGELRHAVSHMTMAECIEQRKTVLSGVVADALQHAIHGDGGQSSDWGIDVEVAQVAQVFIVDAQLRQQLEAEVRNEIKLKSDQSNIRTQEVTRLAEMETEGRLQQQKLAADKEALRREHEKFLAQVEIDRHRANTETPLRLLKIARENTVLRQELAMRQLQNRVKELDVDGNLLLDRARQEMRREILPIEQAPEIVESASKLLQGTNLTIYGEDSALVGQLAPILDLLTRSVQRAVQAPPHASTASDGIS